MDRRKALKHFTRNCPLLLYNWVLFESFTLPRMKKSSVFSGTDEEILADLLILLFNYKTLQELRQLVLQVLFQL
jgi:hypothetical protein